MITRRSLVLSAMSLTAGCQSLNHGTSLQSLGRHAGFVRVDGQRFTLGGKSYRYAGTNLWYGAYMASPGATGDRPRLLRELDALAALEVTNLRVLGASEFSPLKNSLRPAFRNAAPPYNEDLLAGLDYLLAEMAKRGMKAVIFLNNFWEWSGGMVTYQYWVNGGHFIDMNDPAHPWPAFADHSAQFYSNKSAIGLYYDYVASLIGRTNSVTGVAYRDDPAIMAWQLANEPRPGGSADKAPFATFYAWIAATADFIKRHDPNHLVSTGSEGLQGCLEQEDCVLQAHRPSGIDYMTFHIWPLNWGWIDPKNLAATWPVCADKARAYIATHVRLAQMLNKPAVVEEFGLPRDGGIYAPSGKVDYRNRFYRLIFAAVENSARTGGPLTGSNFWGWGGKGRAAHDDFAMRPGEMNYVADPPQEPQGRNSVFDSDTTTLDVIRSHAVALKAIA